jgi:hypothetical protein
MREEMEWSSIDTAPEYEIVETKIDDKYGERNRILLARRGKMWFVPDKYTYVYYLPTHWRRPTVEQIEDLAKSLEIRSAELLKQADEIRSTKVRMS